MNLTRKDEARYLDKDERELVDRTHQPELSGLPDDELPDLRKRLRERRDRARDIAAQQRREIRGKGRARGAEEARDDAGSKVKHAVLSHAMKRLNSEVERRRQRDRRAAMVSGLRESLNRKRAAHTKAGLPGGDNRTAGKGMRAKPSKAREKLSDPREVGRVSQAVKKGQAKRDSR